MPAHRVVAAGAVRAAPAALLVPVRHERVELDRVELARVQVVVLRGVAEATDASREQVAVPTATRAEAPTVVARDRGLAAQAPGQPTAATGRPEPPRRPAGLVRREGPDQRHATRAPRARQGANGRDARRAVAVAPTEAAGPSAATSGERNDQSAAVGPTVADAQTAATKALPANVRIEASLLTEAIARRVAARVGRPQHAVQVHVRDATHAPTEGQSVRIAAALTTAVQIVRIAHGAPTMVTMPVATPPDETMPVAARRGVPSVGMAVAREHGPTDVQGCGPQDGPLAVSTAVVKVATIGREEALEEAQGPLDACHPAVWSDR